MGFKVLDFSPQDSDELAKLAVSAFEQYKDIYDDWDVFISRIAAMPSLADSSEIIVAKIDDEIVGAVGYVAPHKPKAQWARQGIFINFLGLGCVRLRESMGFKVLDFSPQDSDELAKLAVSAFEQYKNVYDDWDVFISRIS